MRRTYRGQSRKAQGRGTPQSVRARKRRSRKACQAESSEAVLGFPPVMENVIAQPPPLQTYMLCASQHHVTVRTLGVGSTAASS
eukprot:1452442-Prymnesium_polylepis.2